MLVQNTDGNSVSVIIDENQGVLDSPKFNSQKLASFMGRMVDVLSGAALGFLGGLATFGLGIMYACRPPSPLSFAGPHPDLCSVIKTTNVLKAGLASVTIIGAVALGVTRPSTLTKIELGVVVISIIAAEIIKNR